MKEKSNISKDRIFSRYPRTFIIIFLFFSILLILLFVEVILRHTGLKPGMDITTARYIDNVKNLESNGSFYTDRNGIFKANNEYHWANGKYGVGVKINDEGFRHIKQKNEKGSQKSVVFIGDSFTWGASAKPIGRSFVDLIAQKGYFVYNFGIPGTGPSQYSYLAEKYVPTNEPDIVAVVVYLGNDINKEPDPLIPNKNLWHVTDDIWLYGFDENGNHLTIEESYFQHYYRDYSPEIFKNKIKSIAMSTVLGKKVWLFLRSIKNKKNPIAKRHEDNFLLSSLKKIKKISEQNGANFLLFVIPVHPDLRSRENSVVENIEFLKGFNPLVPKTLKREDYSELPDGHFNNFGHNKFAEFILNYMSDDKKN